jgi:DNA-binding response OmpR family regulator
VKALVRRAAGHAAPILEVGNLRLDTRRLEISVDGAPLKLSPLEYRLIDYLAHHRGRAVSAGELADHLHGDDAADANAIEALVARVRRKLGADAIETRRGFGYLLRE